MEKKKAINIKRETADRLINNIQQIAKEINKEKENPMFVKRLIVFGSYMSDKERLGDLDIMVKLKYKNVFENGDIPKHEAAFAFLSFKEKNVTSFLDRLFFPSDYIYKKLKNRSTGVSLHSEETDGFILEQGNYKIIFEEENGEDLEFNEKILN